MINIRTLICILLVMISNIAYTKPLQQSSYHAIRKVLIVVAMDTEAQPIIKELNLTPLKHAFSNLPMRGYVGQRGKISILLMRNGRDPVNLVQNIGKEAATLTTYLGIDYFHPDLVISIGTAGGVASNGAVLKEIIMSQKIYFFDRRIPMRGYDNYGRGGYPSFARPLVDKALHLKLGNVCSGDSFDNEEIDYKMFIKEKCAAVEMEAAAVAWVSMLMKTPMIAIKGITNFVRGNDIHMQFEQNLPIVTQELATKLKAFIDIL